MSIERIRKIMVDEIAGLSAIGLGRLTDEQVNDIAMRIADEAYSHCEEDRSHQDAMNRLYNPPTIRTKPADEST